MANYNTIQPRADQDFESYADDAKARRVLLVDDYGSVISTPLDIRQLDETTDNVLVYQGAVVTVEATDLDVRDLSYTQDSINSYITDGVFTSAVVTVSNLSFDLSDYYGLVTNSAIYGYAENSDKIVIPHIDSLSHDMVYINHEHHEIHKGHHFYVSGFETFGSGSSVNFRVTTPDTISLTHMTFVIEGTGATSVRVMEGAVISVDGTSTTPFNNNRNSVVTSNLSISRGDTYSDWGDLIFSSYSGALKEDGFIKREKEIILERNQTYIFSLSNETDKDNIISYVGEWYEEEDLS